MVGCAMRTKISTGRYLHGAHGAPYFDKTLNLLALTLTSMDGGNAKGLLEPIPAMQGSTPLRSSQDDKNKKQRQASDNSFQ